MGRTSFRDFDAEPPNGDWDWLPAFQSLVDWFDSRGRPGISYERHTWWGFEMDFLLYRDPEGMLVGIHKHYGKRVGETDSTTQPGDTQTMVRPDWQRQGIGTALLLESVRRFGTDLDRQRYTKAGFVLAHRVREILRRQNPHHATAHLLATLKTCAPPNSSR